ncbi:aldo/keto reductase [Stigmatella aurantiaca]|uniref:MocA n=1 Tax=Stigmatella aurantiaca (strain DW4/3-1) TaxID=378806 RepID=Q097V7_STIAD|nr:aldo/keto reductase [Stigmatella aurantiaca]ADO68454.1 Oxidoreductase [Stigmatella aurantiaca DW4/3-1]EAU67993.1 MocA [Stigmatella aurantiaca DW4/3-1]
MEYRKLGHSGLKVSSLCLGTMTFGEPSEGSTMHGVACDEKTAFSIMDRALDAGINFWDTANVYGNDGLTERVLGNWFAHSQRRDEVVLATKFRFRMGKGPNDTGASRYQIRSAVEQSLRRLKTDRIDLYQVHMQDIDTPEEETLRALDDLVHQGKVLYLGASNYAAYRLVDSLWTSKSQNLSRFVALQAQYSLVVRDLEREHTPVCEQFGLGILPWSPLAGGFLSGKYRKDQPPPDAGRLAKFKTQLSQFDTPRHWRILEAVDAVAAELKASPSQVSLAWLLRKRAVTSVIFGARNLAQLEDNLKAAELKLDDAQQKRLDDASALELGYPYEFLQRVQGRW